jgi:hypothetical protein
MLCDLLFCQPFTRSFRICRDVLFPAPAKPAPVNPRGRAPDQLVGMRKNFFPLGYANEKLGKSALERGDMQGRVLRSTSARAQSPRLLPNHGFDLREWNLSSAAPAASSADEAARKAAKREKKEAKKRAAESAGVAETPSKKQRTEGEKKKKSKDKSVQ